VKLEWAELALADREAIFLYIAPDNIEAALELDELFVRKAALLQRHPEAGRAGRVPRTRELVVHPHYLLVYDVPAPDRLRILAVVHAARQWPPAAKPPRRRQRKPPKR
jgi:addiction module RelE/StbE family toxin